MLQSNIMRKYWKLIINDADISVTPIQLEHKYSQIIELAHNIGEEGFHDLTEAEIVELMIDEELDEDDLIQIINDNDIDPTEDNEPATLMGKIIYED